MPTDLLKNPHPGEILESEFLEPLNLTRSEVARKIGVPHQRVSALVLGKSPVTADMDLRLAKAFGLSEGFWLRLQTEYDLMEARRASGNSLKKIKPLLPMNA